MQVKAVRTIKEVMEIVFEADCARACTLKSRTELAPHTSEEEEGLSIAEKIHYYYGLYTLVDAQAGITGKTWPVGATCWAGGSGGE